jgi:hypothetical protein
MTRSIFFGSLILWAALTLFIGGCIAPGTSEPAAPTPPATLYSRGDVLAGNMTLAGYDTPDPDIAEVRAVVLSFQPETDTYVYTFVRTLPNGSYGYVFAESWEARLARPRPVFEGYGLGKAGTMAEEGLWKA